MKVSTPVLALFTAHFRKTYMLKKKIPIHTSDLKSPNVLPKKNKIRLPYKPLTKLYTCAISALTGQQSHKKQCPVEGVSHSSPHSLSTAFLKYYKATVIRF